MGTGLQPVPQVPKKTSKNGTRVSTRGAVNAVKLLINKEKKVVGGIGLEHVPIVSYLVINCHKVLYSLGYVGPVSYTHLTLPTICSV